MLKENRDAASAAALDPRIRKTRRVIRQALQDLLIDAPLEQITMRDIARDADVAYTTIFRHYPDKDALVADLAHAEIGRLLALTHAELPNGTYAACLTLFRHVDGNRPLWSALTGGAPGAIRAAFLELTLERAADWPDANWLPHDIGSTLAVGAIIELIGWWLRKEPGKTPEELAHILDRLLVSTLIQTGEQARFTRAAGERA